jgi:uncharacterized protein YegJ (DUF2314 family)
MKVAIATLSLLLSTWSAAVAQDKTILVQDANVRMQLAIQKAKRELPLFLQERANPSSTARDFKVKVAFQSGTTVEHMWVTPFRPNGSGFEGKLKNQPNLVTSLQWGQDVKFEREQISDWAYIKNGIQYGHFTTCVVLLHEGKENAQQKAKELGLRCDDL